MLIALLTVLLLGGGGDIDVFDKEHRRLVQEFIADEEKAAAVTAEMKNAQKSFDRHAKWTNGLVKRWRKSDANPDSGKAELETFLREADAHRSDVLRVYADAILEMRAQVTAEEWDALYRASRE
jgi:hypothetical protein